MPTRQSTVFFLTASLITGLAFFLSPLGTRPLYIDTEIRDFAFYLVTIAGFLEHGSPGIANPPAILYSFTTVLNVLPPPDPLVMPNPISPSAVIIWAPLLLPLHLSLNAAYCAWLGISWGTVVAALRQIWREESPRGGFLFGTFVVGAMRAPPTRICIDIGQTTIFAVGITTLLIQHLITGHRGRAADWGTGLLLFLLSLKAHYFVVALSLVVMERRWVGLCIGSLLTIGSVILCDPFGTYGLIHDFLLTITRYSNGQMEAEGFFWGSFHAHTPTWLNISAPFLPISARQVVNKIAVVIGAILYGILFIRGSSLSRRSRLVATSALVLGVYLCFAPYLSTYDQLLIVIPLLAAAGPGSFDYSRSVLVSLIAFTITLSNSNAVIAVWVTKILLLGGIALTAITAEESQQEQNPPP